MRESATGASTEPADIHRPPRQSTISVRCWHRRHSAIHAGPVTDPTATRSCAQHYGHILRQARRDADYSQRELSRWSGIPASTVARAETDPGSVRFGVILALLRTCGYDLEVHDRSGQPLPWILVEDRRDRAGRNYPAHLDVRGTLRGEWWGDGWPGAWGLSPRPDHTFDLSRGVRDERRARDQITPQRRVA